MNKVEQIAGSIHHQIQLTRIFNPDEESMLTALEGVLRRPFDILDERDRLVPSIGELSNQPVGAQ
jgi:hypothetical protein